MEKGLKDGQKEGKNEDWSRAGLSPGVGDSLTQQDGEFSFKQPTPRLQQVGESILDYEYFRDFDAKIGTAGKVV